MTRPARVLLVTACLVLATTWEQANGQTAQPAPAATSSRASAYYHFTMGHLYAELAGAYGNRGEYFAKAIDHYKQALKLDPSAGFLVEEITDLYVQAGRLKDAVTEAEDLLKLDPDNLSARRMLGRIYARLIGDPQAGKINEGMLRQAIEQYQKITAKDAKDLESWLMLGRLSRVARNSADSQKAYNAALGLDPDNEEATMGLALVYSDIGDTKNAIEMLRRVNQRNPSSRTLLALASAYEQMRDYASAAETLKRALQFSPDNLELKRALAQDLLYSDQNEEALKLYTEIAEAEPRDAQAQLRMAEIFRQKREFDKARAALAKAKSLDAQNLEVRYVEVNLLEAEGKIDDAIAAMKSMLSDTSKKSYSSSERYSRTMLLERLGFLQRSAGQNQAAIDTFRQMAEVDPDSAPRAAVHVIDTYRMAKNFSQALAEAEAARKKFPQERFVRSACANVLADMGKIPQAIAELKPLLTGDKDREIYLAMAQIYEKGKQYADMAKALDSAEKMSETPQDKETIYFMRGAMYERMKQYDLAEAEFRKVLAFNPQNASAMNYLGYMLADRDVRLEEAYKLIRKAVDLDPQNGAYLDSLGWVYYRMNKLEEAETHLRQALERTSTDPTVHDHLGDVYFKQGKLKEAIAQWQHSLKEWETSSQAEQDPAEVAKVTRKLESARMRLAREQSAVSQEKR
jgi:tetratricopeptide (TPR) repeat protein